MGFIQTHSDPGVYVFFNKNDIIIILIYVNNALFLGNNQTLLMKKKQQFMHKWESQDLEEAKEYLRMRISRDCSKQVLKLDQITYAQKMIDCFDMQNCQSSMLLSLLDIIPILQQKNLICNSKVIINQ